MTRHAPQPEDLLTDHADFVRAIAGDLLRDPASADDVVQDTWILGRSPPTAAALERACLAREDRTQRGAVDAREPAPAAREGAGIRAPG